MSCSQFDLALLYDYSDGSLESARRLAVEAHLHRCSDCRGAVADVSRISADLENVSFTAPEPSPGFRERVLAGADVLLKRLAESGGSLTARPPHPVPGIDGDSLVASRPWYVRPIPRFLALAAAILVVLAGLALSGVFFTDDKYVVASIRDIDGLTLNSATATGVLDLFENDALETEPGSGGSFVSLCGMSVVLGAASRVVVLGRARDGCVRLRLAKGSAWICTDDSRSAQSGGVDVETELAEVGALKDGELFLEFSPESRRLRVEVERGRASVRSGAIDEGSVDLDAGHALDLDGAAAGVPRLGRASLDDVALAFLASLGDRACTKRTRIHYDRAKKGPIHWVSGPECALRIAIGFRRPIFALAEDAAIDDQAFERDDALRLAASRFVCVRFERDTPGARALLSGIEDPGARVLPRILLCPRATFMGGFAASAPLSAIVERMENVCVEVLGRVLSAE